MNFFVFFETDRRNKSSNIRSITNCYRRYLEKHSEKTLEINKERVLEEVRQIVASLCLLKLFWTQTDSRVLLTLKTLVHFKLEEIFTTKKLILFTPKSGTSLRKLEKALLGHVRISCNPIGQFRWVMKFLGKGINTM